MIDIEAMGNESSKISEISLFRSWKCCEKILKSIAEKNYVYSPYDKSSLNFLKQLGFLSFKSKISNKGNNYFVKKYILNEYQEGKEILTNAVKDLPVIYSITSVLYGRKGLNRQNLYSFLLNFGFIHKNVNIERLSGFIMLLNYCKILTYSKKTGNIKINHNPHCNKDLPKSFFISPETPFSNLFSVRKIIRKSSNYIWWISKHLGKKVLEVLSEEIDGNFLNEIRLITSINISEDLSILRKNFKRFKLEMEIRGVRVSLKLLTNKKIINGIHDRWFITENFCYNFPPMNSLLQGQHCEILKTDIIPPFNNWWNKSFDIIDEWNKILEYIKS